MCVIINTKISLFNKGSLYISKYCYFIIYNIINFLKFYKYMI
uniref:Uncharacterized protein n=1 Tax=viral metagenome TaxID=1070528 RepID=A0A6C0H7M4_9ZZZZ